MPVEKKVESVGEGTVLAERSGMVYTSSLVTYGHGRGVVTSTGDRRQRP